MSDHASDEFDIMGFEQFEGKLSKLLRLCEQLKAENVALRARQTTLMEEHQDLIDKNEIASTKVTSILTRLRETEFQT